jgi:hypothetical protein
MKGAQKKKGHNSLKLRKHAHKKGKNEANDAYEQRKQHTTEYKKHKWNKLTKKSLAWQ